MSIQPTQLYGQIFLSSPEVGYTTFVLFLCLHGVGVVTRVSFSQGRLPGPTKDFYGYVR